jgi:hypothetical protein
MMKFRDGARLPLLAALPVFLFLILLSASPKHAFSREAPPIFREETDGGGDEWSNELVPPDLPQIANSADQQTNHETRNDGRPLQGNQVCAEAPTSSPLLRIVPLCPSVTLVLIVQLMVNRRAT